MALTRPQKSPDPSVMPDVMRMGGFAQQYPLLFEYLSSVKYEDGSSRETATILVFFEDRSFKVCLSDRDTGRTAWGTGDDLDDCLASLEGRLVANSVEWRVSAWKGKKGRK